MRLRVWLTAAALGLAGMGGYLLNHIAAASPPPGDGSRTAPDDGTSASRLLDLEHTLAVTQMRLASLERDDREARSPAAIVSSQPDPQPPPRGGGGPPPSPA